MRSIIIRALNLPTTRTMIVCVCRRVNDKTIAQAARCGMSFDDIQIDMGVATQCGQCESSARAVWMQCRPSQPTAHLSRQQPAELTAHTSA